MTEELTVKTCLKTIAIKLNALQLFMGTVKKQLSAQTLASFSLSIKISKAVRLLKEVGWSG